jgi:DNA-binding NarL/FixJ family response regulator
MIRVGIIEDNRNFRQTLAMLINEAQGLSCAGEYESIEIALAMMEDIDVLLLDINLPGKSGIEGLKDLKAKSPKMQILMLTFLEDEAMISQAILFGASGYLLKRTPPERILMAIQDVMEGGMPLSPSVAKQVSLLYKKYAPEENETSLLSAREKEILQLMADGMSLQMIAQKLFISYKTVRNHLQKMYDKLHVHSQSEAVAKAFKSGLISPTHLK